jgi:hypothetical protein
MSDSTCHDASDEPDSQDDESNETTLKTPETRSGMDVPSFDPQSGCDAITFIRRKNRWTQKEQYRLKNSLLAGVGLLELANVGDFAANVWNTVPVPHFAMAFSTLLPNAVLLLSAFCSPILFYLAIQNSTIRANANFFQWLSAAP